MGNAGFISSTDVSPKGQKPKDPTPKHPRGGSAAQEESHNLRPHSRLRQVEDAGCRASGLGFNVTCFSCAQCLVMLGFRASGLVVFGLRAQALTCGPEPQLSRPGKCDGPVRVQSLPGGHPWGPKLGDSKLP